jgi:hypothetical protein
LATEASISDISTGVDVDIFPMAGSEGRTRVGRDYR